MSTQKRQYTVGDKIEYYKLLIAELELLDPHEFTTQDWKERIIAQLEIKRLEAKLQSLKTRTGS